MEKMLAVQAGKEKLLFTTYWSLPRKLTVFAFQMHVSPEQQEIGLCFSELEAATFVGKNCRYSPPQFYKQKPLLKTFQ